MNQNGTGGTETAGIGARLKTLRKKHKLSLNALADALGMSYSYLWGLENNKHSISIVNLQKICSYFGVDMIYFFSADNLSAKVKVIRRSETVKYRTDDGLSFEVLSGNFADRLEISLISHPAFAPSERRVYSHNVEGEEFISVLEGVLFVQVGNDQANRLEAGDSICFDCRLDHSIYTEEQPAKFFLISSPPYSRAALI